MRHPIGAMFGERPRACTGLTSGGIPLGFILLTHRPEASTLVKEVVVLATGLIGESWRSGRSNAQ
jgi:hypothetical protein